MPKKNTQLQTGGSNPVSFRRPQFLLEDSTETITAAMVTVAAGVATSMAISTSTMVLSDEPLTLMLGNESFGTSDSEVRL